MRLPVRFYRQKTNYTCGPAVLRMVFGFYGQHMKEERIARIAGTTKDGTLSNEMAHVVRRKGFKMYRTTRASWRSIRRVLDTGFPVIIHYREPEDDEAHYSLIVGYDKRKVVLHDSYHGKHFRLHRKEFMKRWIGYLNPHKDRGWMMVVWPREEGR